MLMAGFSALTGAARQFSDSIGSKTRSAAPPLFSRPVGCGDSAMNDTCLQGKKMAIYSQCSSSSSGQTYEGTVTLDFSDSTACTTNDQGENVTRTLTLTRTLQYSDFPRFNGTTLASTTESHSDYRMVAIGSGTRWTRVASSPDQFEMEILGVHKVLTNSKGREVYDISLRTTSAITVSGDIATQPILSGGTLELIHNTGQFVATIVPSNLNYASPECCHPTSGSLSVSFSGKVEGTGTVTFQNTCGRATLNRNGVETPFAIHGCE